MMSDLWNNLKEYIKANFTPLELKLWLLVVIGFVSYFLGRALGVFYSHLIHSR